MPSGEKSSKARLAEPPGPFLRSGLMARIANCGVFQRFSQEYSLVSLHLRLYGGEGWIRTLGTGLNGERADVCLSYRESAFYPETESRVVFRHCGKPVRFLSPIVRRMAVDAMAESGCTTPVLPRNWFACDCVPAAQSETKKYLRRMGSSKGESIVIIKYSCHALGHNMRISIRGIVSEPLIIRFNRQKAPLQADLSLLIS